MKRYPQITKRPRNIKLTGGLVEDAGSDMPGTLRECANFYASVDGGYTRVAGYERFDGRQSPSSATYSALTASTVASIAVGDTITGGTSGATGKVISITGLVVAYTQASGTFTSGENILVLGSPVATVTASSGFGTARDWRVTQKNLAASVYRALIGAVPGQGGVLGGFIYKGTVYAFRRNASTTDLDLYKSSSSGWVAVPFMREVTFTSGTTEPAEGSTLTQGGVTATVKRVVLETGSFSGSSAAGRLIITGVTGGSFAAGAVTGLTLAGADTAISLGAVGAKVRTCIEDFGRGSRVYGCDGVNRHWEFDGEILVPLSTPVPGKFPTAILGHQKHLFYAIETSVFCSGIQKPYSKAAVDGAAEFGLPGRVTCLITMPGDQTTGALLMAAENDSKVLYGTSSVDFQPVAYADSAGLRDATAQRMLGQVFGHSTVGVVKVSAVQNFGNFSSASVTRLLRRFMADRATTSVASLINNTRSQYRLFFADKAAIYITHDAEKTIGCCPVYFLHDVLSTFAGVSSSGAEVSFFCSSDGFVYQLDAGTSFDGQEIQFQFATSWDDNNSPTMVKRYFDAWFGVRGTEFCSVSAGQLFEYGDDLTLQNVNNEQLATELKLGAIQWDSFDWDSGVSWDSLTIRPIEIDVDGEGSNISFIISGADARFNEFTMFSLTYQASNLRLKRR